MMDEEEETEREDAAFAQHLHGRADVALGALRELAQRGAGGGSVRLASWRGSLQGRALRRSYPSQRGSRRPGDRPSGGWT
jgi:hypothetical protein